MAVLIVGELEHEVSGAYFDSHLANRSGPLNNYVGLVSRTSTHRLAVIRNQEGQTPEPHRCSLLPDLV
jgi:hypothetical protein